MLLCSALLVVFVLPSVFSQTQPGVLPSPSESKSPYESGLALVRSGHIDQAIDVFKKGLEMAPQDKVLLDATGAAYSMGGQLETARDYFNASLKLVSAKFSLSHAAISAPQLLDCEALLASL